MNIDFEMSGSLLRNGDFNWKKFLRKNNNGMIFYLLGFIPMDSILKYTTKKRIILIRKERYKIFTGFEPIHPHQSNQFQLSITNFDKKPDKILKHIH
jgi:hypothetical protein